MPRDPGCKVDRVVAEYGLDDGASDAESIHDRLLARWTGADGRSAEGYRTLTAWFNERLLRRVYEDHGREALGTRVEHDYEALVGDDEFRREDVLESLRADGIDADAILEDLVSWGTMRTHLQECLDGEKDTDSADGDWERDTVSMAESFAAEKVESALSSLASKGELAGVDDASVSVQVHLTCDHCPTRVPFDVALDRGYVCERHSDTDATRRAESP